MKKINQLLKKMILPIVILAISTFMAFDTVLYTTAEELKDELITNSDFDNNTDGWNLYLTKNGSATLSNINGELAVQVITQGDSNHSIQLYSELLPIYQNGVYKLSFDIYSDIDCTMICRVQEISDDYTNYFSSETTITTQKTTQSYIFTQTKGTDLFSRLTFNMGNTSCIQEPRVIYFDNIHLELIDDSNVEYLTEEDKDIITNQVGYYPASKKTAVFRNITTETAFKVINTDTNKTVFTGSLKKNSFKTSDYEEDWYGDFSNVTKPGSYYIKAGNLEPSYPFVIAKDVYTDLLRDTVRMFYLQRCGCEVQDTQVNHPACHTSLATIYGTLETIDVSGGWHDAGDYGRYVVPATKAIADLLLSYSRNPLLFGDDTDIPESGNGIPDILDEVRYELEWLLKMQNPDTGGVYHKVTTAKFASRVSPEEDKGEQFVTPVSTTATGDFAAVMAMAYEYFYDIDNAFANSCLCAAESAYDYLQAHPDLVIQNPSDITTGAYTDASDVDERYWATSQLYRATGDESYAQALSSFKISRGMSWSTIGDYGNIAYMTMNTDKIDSSRYNTILETIENRAVELSNLASTHNYDITLTTYPNGSNMHLANNANFLYFVDSLKGTSSYQTIAEEHLHYILGKNPLSKSFVTGYGTDSPQNPHHRISICNKHAVKGMMVAGVNSDLDDDISKTAFEGLPAAKCYIDHPEATSTNEVTVYWNSSLVYLLTNVITSESETYNYRCK